MLPTEDLFVYVYVLIRHLIIAGAIAANPLENTGTASNFHDQPQQVGLQLSLTAAVISRSRARPRR
jgi:hypothetical protein